MESTTNPSSSQINSPENHNARPTTKNHPPWYRSSSQPAQLRADHEFQEISDGNWTYCYDSDQSSFGGVPVKGFGNVPIVSYEDIAKMPDRRLEVCTITWNINEKSVKTLNYLAHKIVENYEDMDCDLVFISFQEIPSTSTTFHEDALKIIEPIFKSHSLYLSHRAWSQMVIIFIRRQHLKYAIQPQISFIPSGAMAKPVRTKGAIAVCLRIYQRWIVFVGCHLSHATSQQRLQDYNKVVKTLKFVSLKKFHAHGNDDIFSTDVIFWIGDLNFRFIINNEIDWKKGVDDQTRDDLLKHEEFATIKRKGMGFIDFIEPLIRFDPTHKFEPDTDNYVPKRVPSYTDRILFWTRNNEWVNPIKYDSLRGPCPSDHKPVYAKLWLTVINKPIPKKYYSMEWRNSVRSSNDSSNSLPVSSSK